LNSARVSTEHKYFLLAVELKRLHIEHHRLFGVVNEFQQHLEDDTKVPPAAVIDMYVKNIQRIVSELIKTNFDAIDKTEAGRDSLASTALAFQKENESLRLRIDELQSAKTDLEKQLVSVEQLINLARELKDENKGLICDFKALKDSIAVERETDALEIVELTKSFKELIADNGILRRKNEELASMMQQLELTKSDRHRFISFSKEQEDIDDSRQVSSPAVEESSQVSSRHTLHKLVEIEKTWTNNALLNNRETQTEIVAQVYATDVNQLEMLEDRETCSVVAELMSDIRRKNEETSCLHKNIARMDLVLSEMSKTTSVHRDIDRHNVRLPVEQSKVTVNQEAQMSAYMTQSMEMAVENDCSDAGKDKIDKERANARPEEATSPQCETVSNWTSRQTSTDSGSKDHGSNLGDSGLQRSQSQSDLAESEELVGLLTASEQLLAENRRLRSELAKLAAAPVSSRTTGEDKDTDDDREDPETTAALRHQTSQLESEISTLKRSVKEQSVYLVTPGIKPEDFGNNLACAHSYNCHNLVSDTDGNDLNRQEHDSYDDGRKNDMLRRLNALLKEKLEMMELKWSDYEASTNEKKNELLEETVRLRDQTSLLKELAAQTKQIENFQRMSEHQTALQQTVDEIEDKYWSMLDDVDSRRTRLNDDSDFEHRIPDEERTIQVFGRRLESWLKDYESLISDRTVQRINGGLNNTIDQSVRGSEVIQQQIPLEHTLDDAFAAKLEQLRTELRAKNEELKRKDEEIEELTTAQMAASSESVLVVSDHEEELERLMFDRTMLQQQLQEAQYDVEETRKKLTNQNSKFRRQLNALRQQAEDDKASAVHNSELLMAENRHLCDELSRCEAGLHAAEESHRDQQAESAEKLRQMEDKLMTENGRLHTELVAVSAERSQLRDNCTKLENDCIAFQELSNEMLARCERLCIELERLKRYSDSTSHHPHYEIQALKDENSRLMMILEMERLKNFTDECREMTDSQTDTDDLQLSGVSLPASSTDSNADQGVRVQDSTGADKPTSLVIGHVRTARVAAMQLLHLLNAEQPLQTGGQTQMSSTSSSSREDQQVPKTASQLVGIVDKLVTKLDALAKSLDIPDSDKTMIDHTDGYANGSDCLDSTNYSQLRQLQSLLQVEISTY